MPFALVEFETIRRASDSLRLTSINISQELILKKRNVQRVGESPGQGKLCTAQSHVNKTFYCPKPREKKDLRDARLSVPGGNRTGFTTSAGPQMFDKSSAQLTSNSRNIILIKKT